MHHASFAIPTPNFSSHVHETIDLTMHVSVWNVSPIFALRNSISVDIGVESLSQPYPFTGEYTALGSIAGHGGNGVSLKRQSGRFIQPGSFASTGRKSGSVSFKFGVDVGSATYNCRRKGALTAPMIGSPFHRKAIETQ